MPDAKWKDGLCFRSGSWYGRYYATIDGERIRVIRSLNTTSRAVARRRLAKLKADNAPPTAELPPAEAFEDAARRVVADQEADGLKTGPDRLSRLERFVFPELGQLPADQIDPEQIRDVLLAMHDAGKAKQTIVHVRNDVSGVLGQLWRDGAIPENPVKRVRLPKRLRQDKRPREALDDDEFARFMACPDVPERLGLMALTSRAFGGMRTSDLHAWDWRHIDTEGFASAEVYRPKTDGDEPAELVELEIPDVLEAPLRAWWLRWRKPATGPVFPIMKGKRAGQRQGKAVTTNEEPKRQGKRSHARELRRYLWRAGVHHPLAGFEDAMAALRKAEEAVAEFKPGTLPKGKGRAAYRQLLQDKAAAEAAAKTLDAVQSDTTRTRAVDFHGLRRAFNTALAAAGVNVQQAMALAGHKDARTHMRYVQLAKRGALAMPAAAVPRLRPGRDQRDPVSRRRKPLSVGDPTGTRTPVTGVRGRCPNR